MRVNLARTLKLNPSKPDASRLMTPQDAQQACNSAKEGVQHGIDSFNNYEAAIDG
jgi:hypothetical protein